MKPKLSFSDLYDRLFDKGVTFPNHNREDVVDIFKTRSYYYKLSSYRKNFPKSNDGKYSNLTFDALLVSASIDTYLREFLLDMCLDVEHAAKTQLMSLITENPCEDGYSIVEEFKTAHPQKYDEIINRFERSSYKKDMFSKRAHISVWVFLEIIDFGTLIMLSDLYFNKYPHQRTGYTKQFKFIKNVRNTCAHNNVFLINLFDKKLRLKRPDAPSSTFAQNMSINKNIIHYRKFLDTVNLFYVHSRMCSRELKNRRFHEGKVILDKYNCNLLLYQDSSAIPKFFVFLKTCIDFLVREC